MRDLPAFLTRTDCVYTFLALTTIFYFRGQVLQLPDNNGPPLPHLLTGRMNNLILTEVDDQQKQRLQNFLDLKKKLGEPKSDDDVRKLFLAAG